LEYLDVTHTHEGFCKFLNVSKGFGFLAVTNSNQVERDVFCHISDLQRNGIKKLRENDAVRFNVVPDERSGRNRAVDIRFADDVMEAA
jgi:cold shock protein